ncbi:MAG TPA: CHAT domain-containing protein [Puia sp.]|jgi:hypothetical protein|nr:CHAT domain-containing protein [Puia sp.]
MTSLPAILGVFANYADLSAKYLESLADELKDLKAKIDMLQADDKLSGTTIEVDEKVEVLEAVKLWRNKVRVLHYGGHANSLSLDLQKTRLRVDNFVRYIDLCGELKLVVLNGCSTRGFVKRLFESTGVRAIIATNDKVVDASCREFSEEFYDLLLNRKVSLESAFLTAVSNFTKDKEFNRENNIYLVAKNGASIAGITAFGPFRHNEGTRASEKIDNMLDDGEMPVPWGLYLTDRKMMEWKLLEEEIAEEEKKQDLKKKKTELMKRLLEAKKSESKLESDVEFLKGTGDMGKARLLDAEAELKNLKAHISGLKEQSDNAALELSQLSANSKEDSIVNKFYESFFELNYERQLERAREIQDKQKFQGFILQGTPDCAVSVLTKRLFRILEITNETTIIRYDFDSPFVPASGWAGLNVQLGFNFTRHDPDAIAREMVEHYRGQENSDKTQKGFLLLFINGPKDDFAKEETRKGMVAFWEELTAKFTEQDGDRPFDHPIYLFILDNNCDRILADTDYLSSREEQYQAVVAGVDTIDIYPVVQPVNKDTIKQWQKKKEFPNSMLLDEEEISQVLDRPNRSFLPVVRVISGLKVANPNKKQEAYIKFYESYVKKEITT